MSEITLITIVKPKPGKIDEVIKILTPFNAFVKANEPGALHYELFRQVNGDTEALVYLEVFKDRKSREAHDASDEHSELLKQAAEEGLLMGPLEVMELKNVGGFARRG